MATPIAARMHPKMRDAISIQADEMLSLFAMFDFVSLFKNGILVYINSLGRNLQEHELLDCKGRSRQNAYNLIKNSILQVTSWNADKPFHDAADFALNISRQVRKDISVRQDSDERYIQFVCLDWLVRRLCRIEHGGIVDYITAFYSTDVRPRTYLVPLANAFFRNEIEYKDTFVGQRWYIELAHSSQANEEPSQSYIQTEMVTDYISGPDKALINANRFMAALTLCYPTQDDRAFHIPWHVLGSEPTNKIEILEFDSEFIPHLHHDPMAAALEWGSHIEDLPKSLEEAGFNLACDLLLNVRSEHGFKKKISSAIILLSRARTAEILSDKLLYAFTAMESIFVEIRSENISMMASDRMAFFLSDDKYERLRIIHDFKRSYADRSSFVHANELIEEQPHIHRFLKDARSSLLKLIHMAGGLNDHQTFIAHLDDLKYR